MSALSTRVGDVPIADPRNPPAAGVKRVLLRLSAVAYAALDRLALSYRDLPSEALRFPPY